MLYMPKRDTWGYALIFFWKKCFCETHYPASRFCDATIVCEGRKFPVNRVVLAATSKYFNCLFSHPWAQDEREFILKEPTSTGLAEMLTHLTGGRMTLTMANACDVLHAADFLMVPAASKACSAFLVNNLKPCNVLGVNAAARRFADLLPNMAVCSLNFVARFTCSFENQIIVSSLDNLDCVSGHL